MAGKSPMERIQEAGAVPMNAQPGKGMGKSVTLEGLQKEYGKKRGLNLYYDIALAGGFGDLRSAASGVTPPLDLTGLDMPRNAEHKAAVEALFAAADKTSEE
jgi:hypothetical protein